MATRFVPVVSTILAFTALGTTGCTTVAKQAFYEWRGAKANVRLNREIPENALAAYQSVEFNPATTTLTGELCPPEVVRAYDRYASRLERELREDFPGGAPALTVDTDIQFFQGKGLLSGALFLTRVKMRSEDKLVADALVVTESKSFREGGGEQLAETSVKAIAKWLRNQKHPEED